MDRLTPGVCPSPRTIAYHCRPTCLLPPFPSPPPGWLGLRIRSLFTLDASMTHYQLLSTALPIVGSIASRPDQHVFFLSSLSVDRRSKRSFIQMRVLHPPNCCVLIMPPFALGACCIPQLPPPCRCLSVRWRLASLLVSLGLVLITTSATIDRLACTLHRRRRPFLLFKFSLTMTPHYRALDMG